jgi:hypothetical protein
VYAVCLPYIGEISLLITEFVKTESKYDNKKLFKYLNHTDLEKRPNTSVSFNMDLSTNITREVLFEIIEKNPPNLVEVLKLGLKSEDVEVVHISASVIMKVQREYENRIKVAEYEYQQLPENMSALEKYIDLIEEYLSQGILEGEAKSMLLIKQEHLLRTMLAKLPESNKAVVILCNNYLIQKDFNQAIDVANSYRISHPTNYVFWEVCLNVLKTIKDYEKIKHLIEQSKLIVSSWDSSEQSKWKSMCEEVMQWIVIY